MRLLFISVMVCTTIDASSQVIYDSKLAVAYERELKKLPTKIKPIVEKLQKEGGYTGGIVITTFFVRDTLNKKDVTPEDTTIKIFHEDGTEVKTGPELTIKDMPIKLIIGELNRDTLNLNVTTWFMSEETIRHQIVGNKVSTTYNEYYKRDSILIANNSSTPTNDLTIPVKTKKFMLSDMTFTYGKTLYGYAEIETDDFYFLREDNFKDSKIHQRYRLKYYFKITLKKPLE